MVIYPILIIVFIPVPGGNGEKEEDVFANVSAEKALQYSIILAELNQKLVTTSFKPW